MPATDAINLPKEGGPRGAKSNAKLVDEDIYTPDEDAHLEKE